MSARWVVLLSLVPRHKLTAACVNQVLFLLYTIFLTVAAYYGFGQDVWALGIEEAVSAVEYEMIGISFVIIGQLAPISGRKGKKEKSRTY